jgi:protein gp37
MNKSTIEFCDYTWNPIVGCQFSCSYCYARRFHRRFNKGSDFDTPVFHPDRLDLPSRVKKASKIFVGSMCDIFSPGVKDTWIHHILQTVRDNPHHTFQFLTKCPQHYRNFDFPKNVWLGTTVERWSMLAQQRVNALVDCGCKYTSFVLVEPLLGSMKFMDLDAVDFVFVGALTGPGATPPDPEWIASIKHHNVIYKENIKKYL